MITLITKVDRLTDANISTDFHKPKDWPFDMSTA